MKRNLEQAGLFCLNRGWRFTKEDISVYPAGNDHMDVYCFAKGGAYLGPASASFDDSDWDLVELPHDWVTLHEFKSKESPNMGYKERGTGWYRIRFALDEADRDKQILLEFEGLSSDAKVYVNGMLLKRSYSGYNSFCVDMTDMAQFGITPNTLAVHIDASYWEGWWYEGAGIYRNVWLIKKSAVHIGYHDVFLKPEYKEEKWNLHVETTLETSFEHAKTVELKHEIYNPQGEKYQEITERCTVEGYGNTVLTLNIPMEQVSLWALDTPLCYEVVSKVTYDGKVQDFQRNHVGFRTILFDGQTGFYLNGEPVKIKGFCNHQDHTGVGVAVPYAVKEYRIAKLKELGANAYRCAHNPDPEILEICDHMGMMVMEENRTYNSATFNLDDLKEIIKNARNHPSVILYSILNEEPLQGTPKGRRMAGRMCKTIRNVDNTRPVTGAFSGGYMEDDGAATIVDAVGINYSPKRYDEFHEKFPNIPLMGSETASAFMVRGEYKTDFKKHCIDDYDSECAAWGNTVREGWKYVDERPFVAGCFVWTGFDYRGEPTPFLWPSAATFFGTYDSCGFPKNACYLYKAFWTREPMVHLASPWCDEKWIGKLCKVLVASNCEMVRLFINDEFVGEQKVDPYEQALFDVECQSGELRVEGIIGEAVVAVDVQRTAKEKSKIRLELNKGVLESGGFDALIVNCYIEDQDGTVVPNANDLLKFDVTSGTIIGVGNGDPNSHEPDVASYRHAFHGCAQVILKSVEDKDIVLIVKCEGVQSATVTVPVKTVESIPYIQPVNEQIVDQWKLYYVISEQMPDPTLITDKSDMNSFVPVSFSGHTQPELSDKYGCYGMYRTTYDFGTHKGQYRLHFTKLDGYVWFYLDGKMIDERTDSFGGERYVMIPEETVGTHEITVIVKNANKEYPEAGIGDSVFCLEE